jgi:hypothetical protein
MAKFPVKIHVEIDEAVIKQAIERGETLKLIDSMPKVVAEQAQVALANQLAKGAAAGFSFNFEIDDEYGTGPHGPRIPWPRKFGLAEQLRVVVKDVLKEQGLIH